MLKIMTMQIIKDNSYQKQKKEVKIDGKTLYSNHLGAYST